MPMQPGYFKIKIVPSEFRVAPHEGLKVTFRGSSEKFENSISDGPWCRHEASFLLGMAWVTSSSWPKLDCTGSVGKKPHAFAKFRIFRFLFVTAKGFEKRLCSCVASQAGRSAAHEDRSTHLPRRHPF